MGTSSSAAAHTDHPLDARLEALNQRFKLAQLGVSLERRGNMLNLRGTFPPRPGSDRLRPHQQRLSLNLPATSAGLKQAEQQAKIIAGQLLDHSFSWQAYLPVAGGKRLSAMDLNEKIAAFQTAFLQKPRRGDRLSSARTTWRTCYAPYLQKLAHLTEGRSLTLAEAIQTTIHSLPNDSRSRQICCTALHAFAEFLELDLPFDLKSMAGFYSPASVQPRHLPSDEEILAAYHRLPNPSWQFVFGMMATYGLRNHEVFFCDYSALQQHQPEAIVSVLETTKTGQHDVWPFPVEWVETFGLRDVHLPNICTDLSRTTLQQVGQRVSTQFRRYGVPFSPYDLRHAWAVRTILLGLPDTVSARMMGHSVAIHTRTYHRWISRRDLQQAVDATRS